MPKYLVSLLLLILTFSTLVKPVSAQSSPDKLTCDDVSASFSKTGYTNEDVKVSLTFKNPSTAPNGTYRILVSTGDAAFPWGGYQDQDLDFSGKQGTYEYIIPGSNFSKPYKYFVYLENPGWVYNSTMCQFPGSITIFNKNFADLADKCKINLSDNYKIDENMQGSIFIPEDKDVSFYFEIYRGKVTVPSAPLMASTGINSTPVLRLSSTNTTVGTEPANRTLVGGKDNVLQGENIKKLGLGQYTAVVRAVTGGGVTGGPAFHFYCAFKQFQVSRDDTTATTPGTSLTAPGAKVAEAIEYKEAIMSCLQNSKNCTTSKPQNCDPGNGQLSDSGKGIMTAIGCVPTEPKTLVESLIKYASLAAGGIALIIMILAALQMITAEGNPESIKKAQEKFYSAIIGLLLIIFSVLLMQVIGVDILGLNSFGK